MSKSYGNAINLFDPPKETRKRIMGIKTDSTPVESPKNPDTCNVFALYKLTARPDEVSALRERSLKGGMGYGEAKSQLADVVERVLGPARERREKLAADANFVEDVLDSAGRRARETARTVMNAVRDACGIVVSESTHS
jgi:tryptophanyl-tRNA synthetase